MKISAQEEYGLRCLLQLARADAQGESLTLAQIAQLGRNIGRERRQADVDFEQGRTGAVAARHKGWLSTRPSGFEKFI